MADRRRRKSLSIFRPSLTSLTPIHDNSPRAEKDTTVHSAPTIMKKKKLRAPSFLSQSGSNPPSPLERTESGGGGGGGGGAPDHSPIIRPRTLQKSPRPPTLFGSFRSSHSLLQDDDENLIKAGSDNGSINEETNSGLIDVDQMAVLHHGEVQTAGSMFRKRVQYLVLTDTHLVRLKNQSKAADIFPAIPPPSSKGSFSSHNRMSSGSSAPEAHHLIDADPHATIPLQNVVAVYKLDDGRPYFTIELAHYDEATNQAAVISMHLNDPQESELWLNSIRAAVTKARLVSPAPFGRKAIEYAARALEFETDYDPNYFRMFIVAQRAPKSGARSSSDDLGKLLSSISYLIIGCHKIHLLPLPRPSSTASSASMLDMAGGSYGIMCLSSLSVQQSLEDTFHLSFRHPLQTQTSLHLSSSSVNDIALCVRQQADYLRPLWIEQPFAWNVPQSLDDSILPVSPPDDEHLGFDRTLTAYCVNYGADPSNIRYAVNYDCEDAPEFELLAPSNPQKPSYSAMELLSILRSLRYNESFHAVSFRDVKLDALYMLYDRHGSEHYSWATKTGLPLQLPRLERPLLVQELQCLALKSSRLRRLDFTRSLSLKAKEIERLRDKSAGICESVFPLCALQLTNVDWVTLDGLALSNDDVEYVFAAAINKASHFRAVELAYCSLSEETLSAVFTSLEHQEHTLESLNIAGNPGRLSAGLLDSFLSKFKRIRQLNLSKLLLNSGTEPFVSLHSLTHWKLETLILSGTTLNTQTVDALSGYLMSEQSSALRSLYVEQCQMSGEDAATLLQSLTAGRDENGPPREMHLFISENRLEKKHDALVNAIAKSRTPTHLTLRMLEYSREKNFQNLIDAVGINKSLRYLDMSRVSLPLDASPETCDRLRLAFETNTALREIDISGEKAHLEAVTLGRCLPDALRGLERNTALQVLSIEHQNLGLPGASALASVLKVNSALRELYCDDNDISLQAFTTLVNSVRENTSILHVSEMSGDRAWSRSKIDREVSRLLADAPGGGISIGDHNGYHRSVSNNHNSRQYGLREASLSSSSSSSRSTVRRALSGAAARTLTATRSGSSSSGVSANTLRGGGAHASNNSGGGGTGGKGGDSRDSKKPFPAMGSSSAATIGTLRVTEQDVAAAVASLDQTWTAEKERLQGYLGRNIRLAQGLHDMALAGNLNATVASAAVAAAAAGDGAWEKDGKTHQEDGNDDGICSAATSRPTTAVSVATALKWAALDRTPTAELDRQLQLDTTPKASSSSSTKTNKGITNKATVTSETGLGL